jgi:hypothetical protein
VLGQVPSGRADGGRVMAQIGGEAVWTRFVSAPVMTLPARGYPGERDVEHEAIVGTWRWGLGVAVHPSDQSREEEMNDSDGEGERQYPRPTGIVPSNRIEQIKSPTALDQSI